MSQVNRFNAGEALLNLAARAGQGQNFNQRFAQGQVLQQGVQARFAQEAALRLERDKLEQQAQQARLAAATPTQGRSFKTPFTQSATAANAQFKTRNALNLDPATQEALQIAERNNDKQTVQAILDRALNQHRFAQTTGQGTGTVGGQGTQFTIDASGNLAGTQDGTELAPAELKQRGGFVGPGRRAPVNLQRDSKQNVLDNLDVPLQLRAALQPLVDNDDINLKDFAIRASAFRSAGTAASATRGQQIGFERSLIREKVEDVDATIKAVQQQLRDEFQIETLGRSPADILALTQGTPGIANNLGFDIPFTGTQGKGPAAANLFKQLVTLQAEKDRLRADEESVIGGQVSQFQAPPQQDQTAEDLSQIGTDELLRELLGG